MSRRWPPLARYLQKHRREYSGDNPSRSKWEYQCVLCGRWMPQSVTRNGKKIKLIEVDHIESCGPLSSWDDFRVFAERLFVEEEGLRVTCVECNLERAKKPKE